MPEPKKNKKSLITILRNYKSKKDNKGKGKCLFNVKISLVPMKMSKNNPLVNNKIQILNKNKNKIKSVFPSHRSKCTKNISISFIRMKRKINSPESKSKKHFPLIWNFLKKFKKNISQILYFKLFLILINKKKLVKSRSQILTMRKLICRKWAYWCPKYIH